MADRKLHVSEAASKVRMTPQLLKWFAEYGVDGRCLSIDDGGKVFESELEEFDQYLRDDWSNKNVPNGISRELERESRGRCGLCEARSGQLDEAHIDRRGEERDGHCQHPHNLILLCKNCHGQYDDSSDNEILNHTVRHAKRRQLWNLLEHLNRDIRLQKAVKAFLEDLGANLKKGVASALNGELVSKDLKDELAFTGSVLEAYADGSTNLWAYLDRPRFGECIRCRQQALLDQCCCANCSNFDWTVIGSDGGFDFTDSDNGYRVRYREFSHAGYQEDQVLKCDSCGSEEWELEFESLCSYCKHMR